MPKPLEIDYDAWIFKQLTADEIREIEEEFYVTRCDEDYKRKKEEEMRLQASRLDEYELPFSDSPVNSEYDDGVNNDTAYLF